MTSIYSVILLSLFTAVLLFSSPIFSSSSPDIGYFLQITDLHTNVNYSTSGNTKEDCFKLKSGNDSSLSPLGEYGDFECDSPMILIRSALQAAKEFAPSPDFIVWTGDNIAHIPSDAEYALDLVFTVIRNLTDSLEELFPGVKTFPVIGNHDRQPANYLPTTPYLPFYSRLLNESGWQRFFDVNTTETFRKGGYYSQKIGEQLRLIGLNSLIWCDCNAYLSTNDEADPVDQLAWFEQELELARSAGDKALIIAHVPIGYLETPKDVSYLKTKYNEHYVKLLVRYSEVIVTQLWGHAHTDTFRVVQDSTGQPVAYGLVAPAVSPSGPPHFPGLRVYMYDKRERLVVDYDQYYFNLTAANLFGDVNWHHTYTMSEKYGFSNLTAASLTRLISDFRQPHSEKFDAFLQLNRYSQSSFVCADDCRLSVLCAIANPLQAQYESCLGRAMAKLVVLIVTGVVLLLTLLYFISSMIQYGLRKRRQTNQYQILSQQITE